jgi:hypothetical protein
MSTNGSSANASAMPKIWSWSDGYAALRRHAGDERGWIELDSDAHDRRWPRTTGLDVIVIASFVDEAFRRTDQARWSGVALRWASCKDELERDALPALDVTYRGNRDFWSCIAMMFAHLSYVACPLPTQEAWRVLLAQFRRPRNALPLKDQPPVLFASAESLDKLYMAQRTYLASLRGFDRLAPEAGMAGGVRPIPRSTNAEVIQLAEFWTKALDVQKAKNAIGYDTVRAQWSAVLVDIDKLARGADPGAVYPKNHAFWRAIESLSIHVAASLEYGLSDAQLWMASVGQSLQVVSDRAQAVAGAIASGVRDMAADAARGAGKVIGPPLLIGGGILAAILLLRGRGGSARGERSS